MANRRGLMSWLLGSDTIAQVTQIQPHPVTTGGAQVYTGALSIVGWETQPQNTQILTTGVVGSSVPDAWTTVHNTYNFPPTLQIQGGGAPEIKATNAPGGKC